MFVYNYKVLDKNSYISVDKNLGEYLCTHGIPILSKTNKGEYLFSKTDKLKHLLESINIQEGGEL